MPLPVKTNLKKLINPTISLSDAEENWHLIEDALFFYDIVDEYNLACMAATVKVETASTFKPIKEYGSHNYFVHMYWENLKIRKALGNAMQSDAYNFCGRGYIQITGRSNYVKAAEALGLPELSLHPELACDPKIAAKIAAWYWHSRKIDQLCLQLKTTKPEYHRAILMEVRRKVNGGLNGLDNFLNALHALEVI